MEVVTNDWPEGDAAHDIISKKRCSGNISKSIISKFDLIFLVNKKRSHLVLGAQLVSHRSNWEVLGLVNVDKMNITHTLTLTVNALPNSSGQCCFDY